MGAVGEGYCKIPPYPLKKMSFAILKSKTIKQSSQNPFLNFKLSLNSAIFKLISL
ncbi:hypothetical protein HpCOL21_12240 [Helicobacter pylori]